MALPVNIGELLNGKTVEWERMEFKLGWNPLEFLQVVTSFANDINNWGGGYLVYGVESKDGKPVFPPAGIEEGSIDKIQQTMLDLCHRIRPFYFPVVEPVVVGGKTILIVWAPGGTNRPYKSPDQFTSPCT